ncbi:hypothetical protein [Weissella hellenica]
MKERKFKLAFAIGATLPLDMTGELAKNFKVTFKMKLLLQRQC